jgi:hypothetical protein
MRSIASYPPLKKIRHWANAEFEQAFWGSPIWTVGIGTIFNPARRHFIDISILLPLRG